MIVKPGVINDWDLMAQQVDYYKKHLDVFITDQFAPIKLAPVQRLIVRQIGNQEDCKIVCNRGFGKTFVTALSAFGLCVLEPGTLVAVCSMTASQATLILGKLKALAEQNPNIAAQIKGTVHVGNDSSYVQFKNTSRIESYPIDSMRGLRAKMIIVDEAPGIDRDKLNSVVGPIKNYRRNISFSYEFEDYNSKTVEITSACPKANPFYEEFKRTARNFGNNVQGNFACALDYNAAVHSGITKLSYFMKEKEKMPLSQFEMEYGSIFIGSSQNSFFPFDLVQSCRTLEKIELEQPKNCKSRYVITLDIATSEAKNADNSILSVIKFAERADGSFQKKLVYMRSFHGKTLDVIAHEMRILFHNRFPNAERLIYDARGLGDSFSRFMDEPWIDPESGKEYPALVDDDEQSMNPDARPVLHPIRAVLQINQRMATTMRTVLEKRAIELPISYSIARGINVQAASQENGKRVFTEEQLAVHMETDALQIEMGNIIQKISGSGNYTYDTPRITLHKDRYSSVAMGLDYIYQLEEQSIRMHQRGPVCIGINDSFDDMSDRMWKKAAKSSRMRW